MLVALISKLIEIDVLWIIAVVILLVGKAQCIVYPKRLSA
jgi:hypothetical protein